MISRGVEISIVGGVVAMVRVNSLRAQNLPYIGLFTLVPLSLMTHYLTFYHSE